MTIDINCDMGESYGRFRVGNDKDIMPYISSCNIACGMHGGDPRTIMETIKSAADSEKKIGAHPSYPDLLGFGRRSMTMTKEELFSLLVFQISSIYTMVEKAGSKLYHIKVHGALYNDAAGSESISDCILDAVDYIDPDLYIFTLPDCVLSKKAKVRNMKVIHEAFADRRYLDDLRLQSRRIPGAVIEDPVLAANQVHDIVVDREVTTVSGARKPLHAETVCIHGDTPSAVEIAKYIHQSLLDSNIKIA